MGLTEVPGATGAGMKTLHTLQIRMQIDWMRLQLKRVDAQRAMSTGLMALEKTSESSDVFLSTKRRLKKGVADCSSRCWTANKKLKESSENIEGQWPQIENADNIIRYLLTRTDGCPSKVRYVKV
jgi:hypothetical protein